MKKSFWSLFFGFMLLVTFGVSDTAAAGIPAFNLRFNIQLRDNVSVNMGAIILINPRHFRDGRTILVLNGTAQTANTFRPLAETLLSDETGTKVAAMILLNYPGHGNSGLPVGIRFGDLTVNDYVTSLIESLNRLSNFPPFLRPDTLLGHSLGAEIIQLAQNRLVSQGTSLRARFGVKSAVFLVPDIAAPLQWDFTNRAGDILTSLGLVQNDPQLGPILVAPPPIWVALFYANNAGMIIPTATTPDEAVAKGFISIDSATMGGELLGLPPFTRPTLNPGIFAPARGTIAGTITFEQDAGLYIIPTEHRALHNFITGDSSGDLFFLVNGPDTVHNLHVIRPSALVSQIKQTMAAGN
jgi:pimeloyl-ACP methyl ester carboxylesterase